MDLLEREGCLELLLAAWSDAVSRSGRGVLASGEGGTGKTTLVRSFLHEPRTAPARVLWGNCDAQFTPRPLGALRDIASQLDGPLGRLLSAGADRSDVFAAMLDELSRRPTIVVV